MRWIVEWAGQNWSGTQATVESLRHSYLPVISLCEVTWMDRSAAVRSATGRVKFTMMGAATPTVWPLYGTTEATVAALADGAIAATLVGAVAIVATIAMPAAASARRSDLAMSCVAPCPSCSLQQK
jgi:hypothetical protein